MPGEPEGVKYISQKIKSILVRILLGLIKGFRNIIKSFFYLLKPLLIPLKWLIIFFYKYIIINIYKIYYYFRKFTKQIFPAEKFKLVSLFINQYIAHILIILLVICVSFVNLFISETKAASFGENSILYTLATGNDTEGQFIEEGIGPVQPQVTSYQSSQNAAVPSQLSGQVAAPLAQEETPSTISSSGSALIKPEYATIGASQVQRTQPIQYTVKDGDTLGLIASNFGISMQTILWANNLSQNGLIRPGQNLKILPVNGVTHKVVKGDNLAKIAKMYKADENKIIEFNNLADKSDIQVGQVLVIPEGQAYIPQPIRPRIAPIQQIFEQPLVETGSSDGKMLWPNGCRRITQYFSWRHTGVDIACVAGTPIRAADDGTVSAVLYKNTGYGHQVDIDHGGGKMTRYGHMTEIYVKAGQSVQRGQVIGLEGSTGKSTGPHLHFEVRFNNKVYNPLNYIR